MEEIREAALACYQHLSDQNKQIAADRFKELDKSKKGKVSLREFAEYFKKAGLSELASPEFFKAIDTDGNGTLDFNEYITIYYMLMNGRVKFCQECRTFLKGLYFSCVQCFNSTTCNDTYDLCCVCYHNKIIDHHQDATFRDNYSLLTHKRKENIPATQGSGNKPSINKNSTAKGYDKMQMAMFGFGATNFAANIAPKLWEQGQEALNGFNSSDTISTVDSAGVAVDSAGVAVDSVSTVVDAAASCNIM